MEEFETKARKLEEEFEVAEVKINLSTGKIIAGRFWGNKSVKPFICIHGWLDNAGSFDRLIPLLPKQHSYLAIDLPGHGKSSWLPNGVAYHNFDFITDLNLLMKEYKWDKISIIGHSLGAFIGFFFAAIFPEKIDMIISIEGFKPGIFTANDMVYSIKEVIENYPIADQRNQDGETKEYTLNEMIDRIHDGSFGSLTKETALYLLRRGASPSKKQPGKFNFTRDGRLRYEFGVYLENSMYVELVKKIKVPYLVIRSQFPLTEDVKYYEEVLNTFKASNPDLEFHETDSLSHHVHLTEPEQITGIIEKFMQKNLRIFSHL